MPPFVPLFRNAHVQTIAANFWPRASTGAAAERRIFETEPGVDVPVWSDRPAGEAAGEVVLVHGMEGSGDSPYMRGMAAAAVRAGYAAHRFHMRSCGDTGRPCPTLYHAGLTRDLRFVLRRFREEGRPPAIVIGFSLGANVALKLAGELGDEAGALIRAVCGVSTPLDLEAAARRLQQPVNRIYDSRFVGRMKKRLCATGRYRKSDFTGVRSVLDVDERITAPSFGFGTATNYYRTQSALGYVSGVRVPALLIQAKDDPLVPFDAFESGQVVSNPHVRLLATEHGGHLGFLGRAGCRFWAERAILHWISEQLL